jgi:hypothetical protein
MTNTTECANGATITVLPPVLDLRALKATFGIGRTTAYLLATTGEIQSLTLGAPGKRGRRVFLTQSVLELVKRRAANAKPLNCVAKKSASKAPVPINSDLEKGEI